jgi:hypothetical protein
MRAGKQRPARAVVVAAAGVERGTKMGEPTGSKSSETSTVGVVLISRSSLMVAAVSAGLLLLLACALPAAAQAPRVFKSPEEGARALIDAAKSGKKAELAAILGRSYREWIETGDPVQDKQALDRFIAACEEKLTIEAAGPDKALMIVGNDAFPFPIPLVKSGRTWSFAPELGRQEILDRRIGRNEIDTINTLLAIADAQDEYASADREGKGARAYAQRFVSSPGKRNGLYWPTGDGETKSPLGPLVGEAVRIGYAAEPRAARSAGSPYHGYYFRILQSQGANAPGGAYSYVHKGRMIGGFAVIAYPARYGVSGYKTFMINQDRTVYEADFGSDTQRSAESIQSFDPGKNWSKVAAN